MRIIVTGDGGSNLHEGAVSEALQQIGHHVDQFYWSKYFRGSIGSVPLAAKIQNKYLFGPRLSLLNRELVELAKAVSPELIFFYRGTHIRPETLRDLRKSLPKTTLAGYNNDDPFSPAQPSYLWRHFKRSIPFYDIVFAYRHGNLADYRASGAKRVELLRSWYLPTVHRPVSLTEADRKRYDSDVVFIGHFEPDGRLETLERLACRPINLKIFGPYSGLGGSGWDKPLRGSSALQRFAPTSYLESSEYVKALCATKIALCFLSKLNRDTYTRRCFEIPATGAALFSEYSPDLASLFVEGKEVEFFRCGEELVEKTEFYLGNPERLEALRLAGMRRVTSDGHDVLSRMRYMTALVRDWSFQ